MQRGNVGSATFTVTVQPGRRRQLGARGEFRALHVKANTVLTGFLKASDADGDQLTFELVKNESKGKVVVDPGTGAFSFTPNAAPTTTTSGSRSVSPTGSTGQTSPGSG